MKTETLIDPDKVFLAVLPTLSGDQLRQVERLMEQSAEFLPLADPRAKKMQTALARVRTQMRLVAA